MHQKALKKISDISPPPSYSHVSLQNKDMIKYFLLFPFDIYGKGMFVFSHSLRVGHGQNSLTVV